jgi:hypothetical protein
MYPNTSNGQCQCHQEQKFTIRPYDTTTTNSSRCICAPSEDKIIEILTLELKRSQHVPDHVNKIEDIHTLFEHVEPNSLRHAIGNKIQTNVKLPNVDTHLRIGSSKMIDINAKKTITFDVVNRTSRTSEEIITDLNIDLGAETNTIGVSIVDMLHHVEFPENLIETVIDKCGTLKHYIVIVDHGCDSWETGFYLDELHYAIFLSAKSNGVSHLPTFGYQSRGYWKEYMAKRGYMPQPGIELLDPGYKEYVDIYTR